MKDQLTDEDVLLALLSQCDAIVKEIMEIASREPNSGSALQKLMKNTHTYFSFEDTLKISTKNIEEYLNFISTQLLEKKFIPLTSLSIFFRGIIENFVNLLWVLKSPAQEIETKYFSLVKNWKNHASNFYNSIGIEKPFFEIQKGLDDKEKLLGTTTNPSTTQRVEHVSELLMSESKGKFTIKAVWEASSSISHGNGILVVNTSDQLDGNIIVTQIGFIVINLNCIKILATALKDELVKKFNR